VTKTSKRQFEFTREVPIVAGCLALSLLLHGLSIVTQFGEPDTARMAALAVEWHETGQIHTYEYPLRTSPLYIHAIKLLLDAGAPLRSVPSILNWLSLIGGSLVLLPLYLLWRLLTGPSVAAAGALLFSATPAFWLANIPGMAHLPAFVFFVTSLLLFAWAIQRSDKTGIWLTAAAAALAVLAITLKADLILCFGSYLGLVFCLRARTTRNLAAAVIIPVVAVVSVIAYSHIIMANLPAFGGSASTWSKTFPFTFEAVRNVDNALVLPRSVGLFLFLAGAASVIYCLVRRRRFGRILIFVLLWTLPLLLFWGLKMGNSARHMMAGSCALMFLTGIAGHEVIKNRPARWLALLAVLALNYFVGPGGPEGTVSPPPQLHRLGPIVNGYAAKRHVHARAFASLDGPERKLYAGSTTVPYVEWEVFNRVSSFEVAQASPRIYRLTYPGGRRQLFGIQQTTGPATVGPSPDWLLYSFEPGVSFRQDPKWLKYLNDLKINQKLTD
jgi:hypothetical protein